MQSMTGFATLDAGDGADRRMWDIRSVNAKGLDLRMRLPDTVPTGAEAMLRKRVMDTIGRGNVSLTLKFVGRGDAVALPRVNQTALSNALAAMAQVEAAAQDTHVSLTPPTAADVLGLRGIYEVNGGLEDGPSLAALQSDIDALLVTFVHMRQGEGAALLDVIKDQVARIADLTERAVALRQARSAHMAQTYRASVARLLDDDRIDADRVSQDIATLTVKADVTEEIDRLRAHVSAARDLLAHEGPVGRKLDFLTQEFNREANTLCSKAQFTELTAIGLELKVVIDQMREQVQNVE